MALRVRRASPIRVRLITTLMMALALVVQPFYGLVAGQVANAATQSIRQLVVTTDAQSVEANRASAPINVQAQNGGGQLQGLDNGSGNGAHLALSSSSETGQFSNANADAGTCADDWGISSVTMSAGSANKAFCYRDTHPGTYTLTVDSDIVLNSPNDKVMPATQQITVTDPVVIPPTPVLNGENFNTNDSLSYKGINVGFNVKDFGTVSSVKVDLYKDNTLLVENSGTQALNDLIDGGESQLSTPFYIQGGATDEYWNFGARSWTAADEPTKAVVTVTGINGTRSVTLSPLAEPNGWTFESLLPADVSKPTITFINPTRFNGTSYNQYFTAGPNISMTASDDSGIKSTLLHIYNADKTPAKYCPVTYGATTSCDTSSFAQGDYYVIAAATDNAGNPVYVTKSFSIDTTRPTASVTSPADHSYSKTGNLTIEGTASDAMSGIDHVDVYVAHDPWVEGGYVVNGQMANVDVTTGKFALNVSSLPEGSYVVKANAYDKAGNSHFGNAVHVVVDKTAPVIDSIKFTDNKGANQVLEGAAIRGSVTFSVVQVEAHPQRMYVEYDRKGDDNKWHKLSSSGYVDGNAADLSVNTTMWADGEYQVKVSSDDQAWNHGGGSALFTVDNTRPEVAFVTPVDFSKPFAVGPNLAISASDESGSGVSATALHVYKTDDDTQTTAWCNNTLSCDTSDLPSGRYYVKAGATDKAGNNRTIRVDFTIDSLRPSARIVSPSDNSYNLTGNFTIKGTATDNETLIDHVNIYVSRVIAPDANGKTFGGYVRENQPAVYDPMTKEFSYNVIGLADGAYLVKAVAFDAAGNSHFASGSARVMVDTTAPTDLVVVMPSADGRINGTNYTASGTVDGADTVKLCVTPVSSGQIVPLEAGNGSCLPSAVESGVTGGAWSMLIPATQLLDGQRYKLTFTAYDAAGNASKPSVVRDITVDNTAPVITSVSVSPTQLTTKTPVTIKGALGDFADLQSLNLTVADKNGASVVGPMDIVSQVGADGQWSYTLPTTLPQGDYTVMVSADDGVNPASVTATPTSFQVDQYVAPAQTPGKGEASQDSSNGIVTLGRSAVVAASFGVVSAGQFAQATQSGDDTAVLGASTTKDDAKADDGAVKGANISGSVATQKPTDAKFLGLAWYWWLLIVALVASLVYAFAGRRNQDA